MPVPVISIGNLEAGGTGKTPLTIETGKLFKDLMKKLCIVGYAKTRKGIDEPVLIAESLPENLVICGKHRKIALLEAINASVDLIIVDDGFQYFDIKNKIDIVILDPETPACFLIPAGRMRFPLSFLRYADAIFINKTAVDNFRYEKMLKRIKKFGKPVFALHYKPISLVSVKGENSPCEMVSKKMVLVLCGIAKPSRFINMVKSLQPASIYCAIYPDHFEYCDQDIQEIEEIFTRNKLDMVITTEKDMVKLKDFQIRFPLYALSIKAEIENYEFFRKWLFDRLSRVSKKY